MKNLILDVLATLPALLLEKLIRISVLARLKQCAPREALCFLFNLDSFLYTHEGKKAIEYGGGVHTKHRHTRYHDFFVAKIKKGEKVYDIGCGIGALACDIAEKSGAFVTAVDISAENIDQARRLFSHKRIHYICGNALSDIAVQACDVIVLSNVLEHLPDRTLFLREIQRLLKAERFLIRVPLFEREWRVPLRQELGVEWRLDPTHETEYSRESFREEMTSAGLSIVSVEVQWSEIWAELSVKKYTK